MWCSGNKKECRLFLKLIARLFIDNSDKSSLNRKTKEKLCLRSSFRHLFCFQKWMANDDDQRVNNNNNEMINWRKKDERKARSRSCWRCDRHWLWPVYTGIGRFLLDFFFFWFSAWLSQILLLYECLHTHRECREASQTHQEAKKVVVV